MLCHPNCKVPAHATGSREITWVVVHACPLFPLSGQGGSFQCGFQKTGYWVVPATSHQSHCIMCIREALWILWVSDWLQDEAEIHLWVQGKGRLESPSPGGECIHCSLATILLPNPVPPLTQKDNSGKSWIQIEGEIFFHRPGAYCKIVFIFFKITHSQHNYKEHKNQLQHQWSDELTREQLLTFSGAWRLRPWTSEFMTFHVEIVKTV